MQAQYSSDSLQVALLTVRIDQDTVAQIGQAAVDMPWTLSHMDCENYFSTTNRPYLTQQVINAQACIAVIDFDKNPALALETAEFLRASFHHKIAIMALSSATDPDLLLRAMRAGYSEFLDKTFDCELFINTLTLLHQRWTMSSGRPHDAGKILSFFGAKGGVGTTTLAVHLAMFLVQVFKKKVLLIDNHAHLGHVCLYLGVDGNNHYFNELVRNVSRLDQDLLRGFIATHPSGLDILASPDVHGDEINTDTAGVERTLEFLSTQYDFVLIDCEASFEDMNLAIIELSNLVYLVATPEIGAIRDLSRYVDGLIQNEQATDKLKVIVNRYSSHEAVTVEQIEKAIRLPVAIRVANNYGELVRSINVGEPVVSASGKSDFSIQLMSWATDLAAHPETKVVLPAKKRFALWK